MVDMINKDLQNNKKSFLDMWCMIKKIEVEQDDSNISDSDSESESEFFKCNAASSPPLERIS